MASIGMLLAPSFLFPDREIDRILFDNLFSDEIVEKGFEILSPDVESGRGDLLREKLEHAVLEFLLADESVRIFPEEKGYHIPIVFLGLL